ncbi:MAG: DUF1232 domain-containing protein [Coprobacillus sp.]
MNIKERAKQLKTDIPAICLCLKSPKTPFIAKILAFITIVYALSPIDLIPDFIPVVGYLDDVIILPFLIMLTIKFIPKEVFHQFQKESENLWENGVPKKWYYALPIVIIWLIVIYYILKFINLI